MDVMTAFALKIIASVCMAVDHTGAVFDTPEYFRLIGRIAFPVYAYLIASGCVYTKDIKRFFIRLGVFALISEPPFLFAYLWGYPHYLNIFFTLALGVGCVMIYEKVKTKANRWVAVLPALPLLLIGEAAGVDYGAAGVGLIFFIYFAGPENKAARAAVLTAGLIIIYRGAWVCFLFAMASVMLIFFYNGKQGPRFKWAFYVFYPAHITVIGAISFVLSM